MNNGLIPKTQEITDINPERIDSLYQRVASHIDTARQHIQRSIDVNMIKAYWFIGQEIVEEEQFGSERSLYGKEILKSLSTKLKNRYKKGFSVDSLEKARKFYLNFQIDNSPESMSSDNPYAVVVVIVIPEFSAA
jgi:hypothetical protein